MKKLSQKTISLTVLFSLLILIGGFCYGNPVVAASSNDSTMTRMHMVHCAGQASMLEQGMPVSGAMMPCCIDRHDNIPTVLPHAPQEKIKQLVCLTHTAQTQQINLATQKTYVSSPSPPPGPDILSSVIKIE